MENSPSFAALVHEVRGEPVLKVSGELDLHSAPRSKDTLDEAEVSARTLAVSFAAIVQLPAGILEAREKHHEQNLPICRNSIICRNL